MRVGNVLRFRSRSSCALAALPLAGIVTLVFSLAAGPAYARAEMPGTEPIGGSLLGATGTVVQAPPGTATPPDVTAESWVIADAGTGALLAAKDAHKRLPPASTLKTLTAVALLPRLDPAATYTATKADVAIEGSKVGIVPGEKYTVRQMFEGLFLSSGNDTANGLANLTGGMSQTAALMNETARSLLAYDTTAVNPSGLDAKNQLSSAYDLALIARAGLQREDFRTYAGLRSSVFPKPDGTTFELWNVNRFLFRYPDAIGIKSGYTTLARNTLVAAATRNGRTLIVTLLRTDREAWREAVALMDWGFAASDKVLPVGVLVNPQAEGGKQSGQRSAQEATVKAGPNGTGPDTPGGQPDGQVLAANPQARQKKHQEHSQTWFLAGVGVSFAVVVAALKMRRQGRRGHPY